MITCFFLTRKPRLTPALGEWWSLTGVQAGHQTRIMANLRTARKSAYTTGKCVINPYLRTICRKAWITQISARQSYTMGKCVINPYLRTICRKAWITQIPAKICDGWSCWQSLRYWWMYNQLNGRTHSTGQTNTGNTLSIHQMGRKKKPRTF